MYNSSPLKHNFEGNPKFWWIQLYFLVKVAHQYLYIIKERIIQVIHYILEQDLVFVGIIYIVTLHTLTENIEIIAISTMNTLQLTSQMPNDLGVAIKIEKMFDFEDILKDMLSKQNKNVNEL